MKNIEKYIIWILIFVAVGAIGAAVYFGINFNENKMIGSYLYSQNSELNKDGVNKTIELSLEKNRVFWIVECTDVCNAISGNYVKKGNKIILNAERMYGSDETCGNFAKDDKATAELEINDNFLLLNGDEKLVKVDIENLKNIFNYKERFKNVTCLTH